MYNKYFSVKSIACVSAVSAMCFVLVSFTEALSSLLLYVCGSEPPQIRANPYALPPLDLLYLPVGSGVPPEIAYLPFPEVLLLYC